jgi:hypothetical protein
MHGARSAGISPYDGATGEHGGMHSLVFRMAITALGVASFYSNSAQSARADEWGCQVILCLANPGGPTQYAECRPPIRKLWKWLAKGRSFPSCSGAGFESSRPRYDPYYCRAGYTLSVRYGPNGRDGTCISDAMQPVSDSLCERDRGRAGKGHGFASSPRWGQTGGRRQCMAYATSRPLVRERPRYIDVTIDGAGKQRVWF